VWFELQRLIFYFCKEKVPAVAGAFFCSFTGVLRVVLGNVRFFGWCFRGEIVVGAWWIVVD
jgi:hypothetical protein